MNGPHDAPLVQLPGRLTELVSGLNVRRVLPAAARRSVGPFVFFDHFGPVSLPPDADTDVGPHPHIGLATVTYLFEGSLLHRDSLGTVQRIDPGEVNWMTAGGGVVHSERTPQDLRGRPRRLHGLQMWVALPSEQETAAASFQHAAGGDLPTLEPGGGLTVRVLVGQAWGRVSPVVPASPTLYLDMQLPPHADWELPPLAEEMALYAPEHEWVAAEVPVPAAHMLILPPGDATRLRCGAAGARLVLIGGASLPQPVRMWWNFVASNRERLAEASARWASGGFEPIPGETGRVPAPPWRG